MGWFSKKRDEDEEEELPAGYPRTVPQDLAYDFLEWLAEDRERALKSFEDAEPEPEEEQPRRKFLGLF